MDEEAGDRPSLGRRLYDLRRRVFGRYTLEDPRPIKREAPYTFYLPPRGELAAIKSVFGDRGTIAITATKSATGHLLGAAGGIEAIFTILALRDQVAPATLNLDNPDPLAEGLDLIAKTARPMAMEVALSNGFGFGGVNASVIFKRWTGA